MGFRESMIKVEARVNTIETKLAFNPRTTGVRAFFVERAVESKFFESVHECASGWKFEYNTFRQMMVFSYATLLSTFPDLAARSTHIAVGIPDGDGEIDMYEIDPTRRDVVPPNSDDPNWKFFVIRDPKVRFEIPVAP